MNVWALLSLFASCWPVHEFAYMRKVAKSHALGQIVILFHLHLNLRTCSYYTGMKTKVGLCFMFLHCILIVKQLRSQQSKEIQIFD